MYPQRAHWPIVLPDTPASSPASPARKCPWGFALLATRKICPARAWLASPGRGRAVRVGSADGRDCSAASDLYVPQADVADADPVAIVERRLAHPLPVDIDAVQAPVVEQHGASAAMGQHGVAARHGRILELDVGCGAAPDVQAQPIAVAERVEHELTTLV